MERTFGRHSELALLDAAEGEGERLVAITGSMGIGKTHLARAWLVARAHLEVDASEAASSESLDAAVLAALQVAGPDRLVAALRAQQGWLFVDDVTADAIGRIAEWVRDAEGLRVVITTRTVPERARVLQLGPLTLPEGEALDAPSVQLLAERTKDLRQDVQLSARDACRIARAVDGVPLALELAASRVVFLGPERLLERLEKGPGALGGDGTALGLAVSTAWESLPAADQSLLQAATTFRGTFDVDALLAVAGAEGSEEMDVFDGLTRLCQASLLRAHGDGRFHMLWSIRDFVASTRAPTEAQRRAHAAYFADLGEAAALALRGADARHDRLRLRRAYANLFAAARANLGIDSLRAALALAPLVLEQGPLREYAALLEVRLAGGECPVELSTQAHVRRAEALVVAGDPEGAEEALARLPQSDADAERVRVKIALTRGDLEGAVRLADAALAAIPADALRAPLLVVRAAALGPLGRLEECREDLRAALAEYRTKGWLREEGRVLAYLGNVFTDLDEMDDARFCLAQAEAIHEASGDRFGAAFTEANRGLMHHKAGDVVEAMARYDRALPVFETLGATWYEACFRAYRAMAFHQDGGDVRAVLETLRVARADLQGDDRFYGYFTAYEAVVVADERAFQEAEALLDDAWERIERSADPTFSLVHAMHRATIRRAMGEDAPMPEGARLSPLTDVRAASHRPGASRRIESVDAAIAADGGGLSNRRGECIDLRERDTLRRVLAALVRGAEERPGEPVPRESLVAAGWPGERMIARAAANRLRVAIATLRKLGLQEEIVTQRGAYLLRPEARIVPSIDYGTAN
ncbi:MAG: hypothetical protein AAF645_03760 [Myxococcota bacterium]